MSYAPRRRPTIIVENSPVSFAIMGPGDPHRHVLIRSNDQNLDLVGLDNRTFLSDYEREAVERSSALGGMLVPDPRALIVRTSLDYAKVSNDDVRSSHLSFAWRGLANNRDLENIKEIFHMVAADLIFALDETTPGSVEWQVAPLVALCRSATDATIRRSKLRRAAMIFTLLVYGIMILAVALNFPLLLERVKADQTDRPPATAPQVSPAREK